MRGVLLRILVICILLFPAASCFFLPSPGQYYGMMSLIDELEDFTHTNVCVDTDGTFYLTWGNGIYTWTDSLGLRNYTSIDLYIEEMEIDTETSQLYILTGTSLWEINLADASETLMKNSYEECNSMCIAGNYIILGSEYGSYRAVKRSDFIVTDTDSLSSGSPVHLTFVKAHDRIFMQLSSGGYVAVEFDQTSGQFGSNAFLYWYDRIRAVFPDGTKLLLSNGEIYRSDVYTVYGEYLGSLTGELGYWYDLSTACFFNECLVTFVNDTSNDSPQQGLSAYSADVPFDPVTSTIDIDSIGYDLLVSGEYIYLFARPRNDDTRTRIYRFDDSICQP